MKLIRIKAIAKKEMLQVLRDPLSLALAFVLPVLLLVIFGYAITFDIKNIGAVICDQDRSSLSRDYVSSIVESGYFKAVARVDDEDRVDAFLDRGEAEAALIIPSDFSRKLRSGRPAQVAAIVDGSDSNTATIALGYLTVINQQFGSALGRRGPPPIEVRSRVWYNPELKSRNFIIPGLIVMIMAIIVALLTSLTIAREWERGTMEQLIATPVKPAELIIGKLVPYLVIGFGDTVLSVAMGTLVFGVPIRGSLTLLFTLATIFIIGGLSFGILLSILGRTQLVASQIAMVSTFLPVFLLSGFVFAISNMPKPLQVITYLVQARYFVTISKGIFLKGSTLAALVPESVLLVAYAVLVFTIAVRKFKKKVP
jgi:drug efflux transport system permease protein